MKTAWRNLAIFSGLSLAAVLIGPFLVPVHPLEDTLPEEELADKDSKFKTINGVKIHYKTSGELN